MPSYDYKCVDCEKPFTVERSMTDSSETSCAHCGGENVNRVWNVYLSVGQSAKSSNSSSTPAPAPSGGSRCGSGGCC